MILAEIVRSGNIDQREAVDFFGFYRKYCDFLHHRPVDKLLYAYENSFFIKVR